MRWLDKAFTGTGVSSVFYVRANENEIKEVHIGLVDLGSSVGIFTLKTLNPAATGWVTHPRGATFPLSIATAPSFITQLTEGYYCLQPDGETGTVGIGVNGEGVEFVSNPIA